MKEKKSPQRKCIACNEMKDKKELIRIVKSPDGTVFADFSGKKNGRGCYICKNPDCFALAKKARRIERAFSMQIAKEVYDTLETELMRGE